MLRTTTSLAPLCEQFACRPANPASGARDYGRLRAFCTGPCRLDSRGGLRVFQVTSNSLKSPHEDSWPSKLKIEFKSGLHVNKTNSFGSHGLHMELLAAYLERTDRNRNRNRWLHSKKSASRVYKSRAGPCNALFPVCRTYGDSWVGTATTTSPTLRQTIFASLAVQLLDHSQSLRRMNANLSIACFDFAATTTTRTTQKAKRDPTATSPLAVRGRRQWRTRKLFSVLQRACHGGQLRPTHTTRTLSLHHLLCASSVDGGVKAAHGTCAAQPLSALTSCLSSTTGATRRFGSARSGRPAPIQEARLRAAHAA